MTEIDLGADIEFKVKYAGKEYSLREPTVNEVENFKGNENGQNGLIDFLSKIGLPAEVAGSLPMSKLRKLVDGLTQGMTEKK